MAGFRSIQAIPFLLAAFALSGALHAKADQLVAVQEGVLAVNPSSRMLVGEAVESETYRRTGIGQPASDWKLEAGLPIAFNLWDKAINFVLEELGTGGQFNGWGATALNLPSAIGATVTLPMDGASVIVTRTGANEFVVKIVKVIEEVTGGTGVPVSKPTGVNAVSLE